MLVKFVAVVMCVLFVCQYVTGLRGRGAMRRRRRNGGGEGLPRDLHAAYVAVQGGYTTPVTSAAAGGQSGGNPNIGWNRFTPSLPAENEIECHVAVTQTHLHGGRCTRLAGVRSVYMCQSAQHLQFSTDCAEIVRRREAAGQQASTES